MVLRGLFLLVLLFYTVSCSPSFVMAKSLIGTYYSSCTLYGETELVLLIKENGDFEYRRALLDIEINGTWEVKGRQLILKSNSFLPNAFPDGTPEIKYTDNDIDDVYTIRSKGLYPMLKNSGRKNCFLRK